MWSKDINKHIVTYVNKFRPMITKDDEKASDERYLQQQGDKRCLIRSSAGFNLCIEESWCNSEKVNGFIFSLFHQYQSHCLHIITYLFLLENEFPQNLILQSIATDIVGMGVDENFDPFCNSLMKQ